MLLGPNPAGNLSKTLCASSPQGPRCISCSEEIKGKRMCTSYVSMTFISYFDDWIDYQL